MERKKSYQAFTLDKIKPDVYYTLDKLIDSQTVGSYSNEIHGDVDLQGIQTYIYHKLINKNDIVGYIACTNAKNYTKDDLNILSILAKQVAVAMQLYEYSKSEVKHQV